MKIEVISSNWQRSKKDCQASDNFLTLITQRRFQLNRFIGDLEKRPCGFHFLLRANWHVWLTARYNRLYYMLYFSHYSRPHLKYSTSECRPHFNLLSLCCFNMYILFVGQMFVRERSQLLDWKLNQTKRALLPFQERIKRFWDRFVISTTQPFNQV